MGVSLLRPAQSLLTGRTILSSISGPSGTGNSAGVRGMVRFVAFYMCSHE